MTAKICQSIGNQAAIRTAGNGEAIADSYSIAQRWVWHLLLPPNRVRQAAAAAPKSSVAVQAPEIQAEDPKLERKLAIKVMLPSLAASESARKRFLREANTAAAIEHDHIVALPQVGEDRGVPFIAMPFLKGEPLDIPQRAFSPRA